MRYFTFLRRSCLDILGKGNPLVLVSMDGEVDDIPGSSKKIIKGDTSVYKTVANEYGNMYDDVLEFEYSLIKLNDELITPAEQRVIETWLTSPKLSQYLQLYNLECEDGNVTAGDRVAIYCGTFVETEWIPCGDGYIGLNFTFQCDSPYAWQFNEETRYITGSDISTIEINSDETHEYIYPRLTFTALNDGDEPILHDIDFTFHVSDPDDLQSQFTMTTQINKEIIMDCKSCRITDNAGNLFRYDDLGWGDIGNIYWPRFYNGFNSFDISTDENVTIKVVISYMSPHKIVGGWL